MDPYTRYYEHRQYYTIMAFLGGGHNRFINRTTDKK